MQEAMVIYTHSVWGIGLRNTQPVGCSIGLWQIISDFGYGTVNACESKHLN